NVAESLARSANGVWDVQFLAGDLNFRVRNGHYTRLQFCDHICYNRNLLFNGDSLSDSALGGAAWHFPAPFDGAPGGGLYWPTYKKFYKGTSGATARNAVNRIWPPNVNQIFDIKLDRNDNVKEGERAGMYDFGWLDRVGWRKRASSTLSVT